MLDYQLAITKPSAKFIISIPTNLVPVNEWRNWNWHTNIWYFLRKYWTKTETGNGNGAHFRRNARSWTYFWVSRRKDQTNNWTDILESRRIVCCSIELDRDGIHWQQWSVRFEARPWVLRPIAQPVRQPLPLLKLETSDIVRTHKLPDCPGWSSMAHRLSCRELFHDDGMVSMSHGKSWIFFRKSLPDFISLDKNQSQWIKIELKRSVPNLRY